MLLGNTDFRIVKSGGTEWLDPRKGKYFVKYKFDNDKAILHTSIINGHRSITEKGRYQECEIDMWDLNTVELEFLDSIRNQVVYFMPHRHDNPDFGFYALVQKGQFYYKDNCYYKDAFKFKILSVGYTDIVMATT